jgi:protein-L-isoaspartate(D-aspartate) O-methyltransferase
MRLWPLLLLTGGVLAASASVAQESTNYRTQRLEMVRSQIQARDVEDERVLDAMRSVRRHVFVPEDQRRYAYADSPLPIGLGQTISQPYIVGKMTELLQLAAGDTIFELGTGSGYQAAVASRLCGHVFSMEILGPLATRAKRALDEHEIDNVSVRAGDGYYGWPEKAPFDAIIVTAATPHIPPPLLEQLAPGGRMVLPVGPAFATQRLVVVEKDETGSIHTRSLFPVRFVPLTGEH